MKHFLNAAFFRLFFSSSLFQLAARLCPILICLTLLSSLFSGEFNFKLIVFYKIGRFFLDVASVSVDISGYYCQRDRQSPELTLGINRANKNESTHQLQTKNQTKVESISSFFFLVHYVIILTYSIIYTEPTISPWCKDSE